MTSPITMMINNTSQLSQPNPTILPTPPSLPQSRKNYLTRLFSGRLNRQNYIIGSTLLSLPPVICFFIVIFNILLSPAALAMPSLDNPSDPTTVVMPHLSLLSLLQTPANELWSAIGILFIILSIPYLFSLQIRRLHDLNLNGWLWTINFVPLLSFYTTPIPGYYNPQPTWWFLPIDVISLLGTIFTFYVTLWAGTNGPNKYGEKPIPRTSLLKDILEI
jgi:uncharacterized membrane protein YhaH (DUF805 family)